MASAPHWDEEREDPFDPFGPDAPLLSEDEQAGWLL
jgi:hypothetical protein